MLGRKKAPQYDFPDLRGKQEAQKGFGIEKLKYAFDGYIIFVSFVLFCGHIFAN